MSNKNIIDRALYWLREDIKGANCIHAQRTILTDLVDEVTAPLHKQLEQIADALPCDVEDLCDDEE